MKNSGRSSKPCDLERKNSAGKSMKSPDLRSDRKSGTGYNGSPKKGGHGGKYTWAGDGISVAELGRFEEGGTAVDANDPNFVDDGEVGVSGEAK